MQAKLFTQRRFSSEVQLVAAIALVTMLAPLNSTMIAIALPRIADSFGVGISTASVLVPTYLFIMAVLQPIAGGLGDRLSRRRLILASLVVFGLASAGAALSFTMPMLIGFRLAQALAGALAFPNGVALLREAIPSERRGLMSGTVGSAASFAAALGPVIGGVLVQTWGWQAVFLTNVPFIAAALALGAFAIPQPQPTMTAKRKGDGGSLRGNILDLRTFVAANATVAFSNLAMYVTLLAVPILLTRQLNWSASQVGFTLAGLSVMSLVCAPVGGRWADTMGRRMPVVLGLSALTVGCLLVGVAQARLLLPMLIAGLMLMGAGLGIAGAGMQTAASEAVSRQMAGTAAGLFSTSRYCGSIVGSTVWTVLISAEREPFNAVFALVFAAATLSLVASVAMQPQIEE
ncbi:MAG: MFS transporter [Caldilinea sp. CFX5]|nr:MFS transporter [Caldilinea sp. CFX5]